MRSSFQKCENFLINLIFRGKNKLNLNAPARLFYLKYAAEAKKELRSRLELLGLEEMSALQMGASPASLHRNRKDLIIISWKRLLPPVPSLMEPLPFVAAAVIVMTDRRVTRLC